MARHNLRGPGGKFRKKGGSATTVGGGGPPAVGPWRRRHGQNIGSPNQPPPININIPPPPRKPAGGGGGGIGGPPNNPAGLPPPAPNPTINVRVPPARNPPPAPRQPRLIGAAVVRVRGPGNPGIVAVLLLILLVFVEWDGFFGYYLGLLLRVPETTFVSGKGKITSPIVILGALVFIAMAAGLASIDSDWSGSMIVFVIGLWIVFLVFNPEPMRSFLSAIAPHQ